jgi:uncharacterized membrane protein (DUF485 family)
LEVRAVTSTDLTVHAIAAQRWKIVVTLSVLMWVIYFGVILLVAFGRSFLLVLLAPGLSVGILLNAVTIVACWVPGVIYVAWANGGYDEEVAQAVRSRRT